MEAIRAEITANTASFRYPMFIIGYQPTFPVPPPTTIYGLLSAAKGEKVSSDSLKIGYEFTSTGRGTDLEKLYEFSSKDHAYKKSNVITREFLYQCNLTLYISDLSFESHLKKPQFTLLLGRQSDLAYVKSVKKVDLEEKNQVEINNTIIPFDGSIPGQVITLPTDFTDEATRKPLGIRTFVFIESPQTVQGFYDPDRDCGVYFHDYGNQK